MDVIVGLVVLAVFVGTWWWLAKEFRKSGRGFLIRQLLGCAGGWMASLLVAGIAVSTGIVESKSPPPAEESRPKQPAPETSSTSPAAPQVESKESEQLDYAFSITKDEYRPGQPRRVEVLLSRRLTDAELTNLAAKLKAEFEGNPQKTFIGFRVEGQNDTAYWARASFDPDYGSNLIGLSLADYERLRTMDLSAYRGIKGSWLRDGGLGHVMVLYLKDGKYFIDSLFPNGGKNTDEYSGKPVANGSLRLEQPDNGFGEYLIAGADGTLQGWGENGIFMTLQSRTPTKTGERSHKD